jgi:hypothetical protein
MMVAVTVTLVGCSSGGSKDEGPRRPLDTSAPAGSTVATDAKIGFAITLPSSWKQLPTDAGKFDAAADPIRAASDKVGTGLAQLKSAVRSGANLAAIDPETGATVNLIVLDAGGSSLDKIATQSANLLRGNGASDITREQTTVDGVPAVRQRFRQRLPGETGAVDVSTTQLYVLRRGQEFVLTLSGDDPGLDSIAASLKLA